MDRMTDEGFRAVTPLIYSHVNPYGGFELEALAALPAAVSWRT